MTRAAQLAIDEENPWPGPRAPSTRPPSAIFNGRQEETAELRRLVLHGR